MKRRGTRELLLLLAALSVPLQTYAQGRGTRLGKWALRTGEHHITEHFFSVALVAAAHTSKEGIESLNNYIESGDLSSWNKFFAAFGNEVTGMRLHTEIVGYHAIDIPVEFLAKMGGKFNPGVAAFNKSILGKMALGVIGFYGYDFVADLNRCVEEKVVASRAHSPLEAKVALEKISSAWTVASDQSVRSEYSKYVKECLESDLPLGQMAFDRFWDAGNLLFIGALIGSIELGDWIAPGERKCARHLMKRNPNLARRRAIKKAHRVRRVVSSSTALASIGFIHQALETRPFRATAEWMNTVMHETREAINQDELQDLLFQYVKNPSDPALMSQILETRGALLSNLLAEVNIAAKPLWEVAENFAQIDPAVRGALANDPARMEERIQQSLDQLHQVREWLKKARQDPSSPTLSEFSAEGLTPIQVLEQLQSQLEELYFPKWWLRAPREVAQVMRQTFAHLMQKANSVSTTEVDTLRVRVTSVMEDLGLKFKRYGAPADVLAEHEKVMAGLAKLLNFGGPTDTQMLRKLELIERYSHMSRPDVFLARAEDLNWSDPKWFRVLGQDPRLGLRGY